MIEINYTFKHMDATDAIKGHAEKKFEKVTRLEPGVFDIHFIFEVDKLQHKAELMFQTKHGRYVSHHISENLYMSIDGAIDKILHQLKNDKGKHKSHKP